MTQVEGGGVPAGTQLNGIYEIEKRIAMGGMGEVYVGRAIQTGDRVAIKMILPEHASNEIILDLFRREASTLHNLYHEAIVRYYVFSVDPGLNRPYLSMEFAAGPSLGDRLREAPLKEERLTVLRQRVAGGLHAAHKLGVVHRDISPDNIILVDGEVGKAKIIDFGIAKSQAAESTLIGSGFAGKLNYVSPEQLGLFGGEVTGKSDIYSLGLVFAEAAIGKPLPMGGSQVEVIEKRRTVPDLSEIPLWIRPLIEWMIQPDPADRPADMQAVADWTPAGATAATTPAATATGARPVHPRERRRQQEPGQGGGRRRGVGLWLGLGGVGIAAAAAAGFVLLGGETGDLFGSGSGSDTVAEGGTLVPAGDALSPATAEGTAPAGGTRIAAPAASVTVPAGRAGESYAWSSSPFDYDGDPADLAFEADGALPPGLSVGAGPGGAARLWGTPGQPGEYVFAIVAAAPGGGSARLGVSLEVAEADQVALAPPTVPSVSAGGLKLPASGDSGAPALTPQDGEGSAISKGGAPMLAPTSGAGSAPVPPPADKDPTSGSEEPTVAVALPGALATPAEDASSAGISTGGAASSPVTGQSSAPWVAPQGSADALPILPPADEDPTADAAEPAISSAAPGLLSTPAVEVDGTSVAAPDSGALQLPPTGANRPQQPSGTADAGGQAVASVPSPQNQPPTIETAVTGPVTAAQGQPVNAHLGSFFDEAGANALDLKVDGDVPNGLSIRLAEGGIAQLHGSPAEYGHYEIRIATVDPHGLVSQPIVIDLRIDPPAEHRNVRDYILGYKGGDCFLSRPLELGPQLASIEVFASEDKIQPVIDFDAAFKRDMGFEANIGMRPISPEQCPLIHALDEVGAQAIDNSLVIDLDRDELASGDRLSGKVRGGQGARLFLYDHLGGLTDLSRYIETKNGETGFSIPVTATGPQILVAARARDGADVPDTSGLEAMLGAAKRGEASLGLGFFIMQ